MTSECRRCRTWGRAKSAGISIGNRVGQFPVTVRWSVWLAATAILKAWRRNRRTPGTERLQAGHGIPLACSKIATFRFSQFAAVFFRASYRNRDTSSAFRGRWYSSARQAVLRCWAAGETPVAPTLFLKGAVGAAAPFSCLTMGRTTAGAVAEPTDRSKSARFVSAGALLYPR